MQTPSRATHFGLKLVQSLVNQMGGTLSFTSATGNVGTLVTLTIPEAEQPIDVAAMPIATSFREGNPSLTELLCRRSELPPSP
jgi:hypothetical protein